MELTLFLKTFLWYWKMSCILSYGGGNALVYPAETFACATAIYVTNGRQLWVEDEVLLDTPHVIVAIEDERNLTNELILQREFTEDDLLNPHTFADIRLNKQCSVVIWHESVQKCLAGIFNLLVSQKLVLADRDIFVFGFDSMIEISTSPAFNLMAHRYLIWDVGQKSTKYDCERKAENSGMMLESGVTVSGQTLVVAALAAPQFYRSESVSDGLVRFSGGTFQYVVQELSLRLNFTLHYLPVTASGSKEPNGKWTGAMGAVFNSEADFTAPMGLDESRNSVVSVSDAISTYRQVFWVSPSAVKKTAYTAILKPLSLTTWVWLFLLLILAIPVLFAFIRPEMGENTMTLMGRLIDIIVRLLLEQSTALRGSNGNRTRSIIMMGALFSTILGTSYRSKLYYFLTFAESDPVPRTYNELAFSDYKLYFRMYGGVGYKHLTESKDSVHLALLHNNRLQLAYSTLDCIQKVFTEEKAACLDYDFSGGYAMAANGTLHYKIKSGMGSELFKQSDDWDAEFMVSMAFRKRSPLTKIFNDVVKWINAAGLYDVWKQMDWDVQKIQGIRYLKSVKDSHLRRKLELIEDSLSARPVPLPLTALLIPFQAVGIFALLGIALLMIEMVVHKRMRKWEAKRKLQRRIITKVRVVIALKQLRHGERRLFSNFKNY